MTADACTYIVEWTEQDPELAGIVKDIVLCGQLEAAHTDHRQGCYSLIAWDIPGSCDCDRNPLGHEFQKETRP